MDPVSAFSLSCNVIQLIQAAASTGQVIYAVCQTGKVEGVDHLETRLGDLDKLLDDTKTLSQQPFSQVPVGDARQTAAQILQTCSKDAALLRTELQKLNTTRRGLRRFAFAVKTVAKGSANKVEDARLRLENSRSWLTSSLIPIMASDIQGQISRSEIAFSDLNEESRKMLQLVGVRFNDLEASNLKSETKIIDTVEHGFSAQTDFQAQTRAQAMFEHAQEQNRSRLLTSLTYSRMNDRINSIPDHSESTFDWIFDPFCEYAKGSFSSWLLSKDTHFWVQGKAGSGKSTLMKRLWSDQYTRQLLSLGDDVDPSLILKHSFWLLAENVLRKSYKGMLLSMIHGILSSNASAIDWLLAKNHSLRSMKEHGDWGESTLQETLFTLLDNQDFFSRTCIFLDALDEVGSAFDRNKILHLIDQLCGPTKSHIKICTSSRPERPWSEQFRSAQQLSLEDLTAKDIEAYARKELEGKLPDEDQEHGRLSFDNFLEEIVRRSEGVFLGAHLAIETLLNATAHASRMEIEELLTRLPSGMMELYNDILSRRAQNTNSVKAEAATYLRLCLTPNHATFRKNEGGRMLGGRMLGGCLLLHRALPIWKTIFGNEEQYLARTDEQTYRTDMLHLEERIQDICAGLLKPRYGERLLSWPYERGLSHTTMYEPAQAQDLVATYFEFSHRTVADFLTEAPVGRDFLERCTLSSQQLLFSQIDAELLRCQIWHQRSQLHRSIAFGAVIVKVVEEVAAFSTANPGPAFEQQLLDAIQRLKDSIMSIHSPQEEQAGHDSTEAGSSLVFDLAKVTSAQIVDPDSLYFAHDVEGLLLEFGVDVWFKKKQERHLWPSRTSSHVMTAVYKDYLLLCATNGNLPVVARRLINSGANFYADHYLPLSRPEKHSAAGVLLRNSGRRAYTSDDIRLWAEIVSCCSATVQFERFEPLWWDTPNAKSGGYPKYFKRFFHIARLAMPIAFVLDVSVNLQLWLCHAATNSHILPIVDPDTFVGFVIMRDGMDGGWSIQPFSAKSWAGLSYLKDDEPQERLHLPNALPAVCSQCLADANDGFWSLVPNCIRVELCHRGCEFDTASGADGLTDLRLHPTMQNRSSRKHTPADKSSQDLASTTSPKSATGTTRFQPTDSWRRQQWRSFEGLAADWGFYKDPSDPCVAQRPLPMLESVRTDCS